SARRGWYATRGRMPWRPSRTSSTIRTTGGRPPNRTRPRSSSCCGVAASRSPISRDGTRWTSTRSPSAPSADGSATRSSSATRWCASRRHRAQRSRRAPLTKIDVLQGDVEVGLLEQRDRGLQVVAALGLYAQLVALNLSLHRLRPLVANDLADLLRVGLVDALFERGLDAVLLSARERLTGIQRLER